MLCVLYFTCIFCLRRITLCECHGEIKLTYLLTYLQATVRCGIRSVLCDSVIPTVAELVDSADETLFKRIVTNPNHVLYQLLFQRSTTAHNLRPGRHDRTLPDKQTRLYNSNSLIRKLFKDCYQSNVLILSLFIFFYLHNLLACFRVSRDVHLHSVNFEIKRICYVNLLQFLFFPQLHVLFIFF